ncbi:MAG: M3 family metallopeptidase [Candidatus Thorarchaeota archaeon]
MTQSERSWDLSVMVDGAPADKVKEMLDALVTRAEAYAEQYASKIPSMSASDIKEMLSTRQHFQIEANDVMSYGRLRFSADTTNKESGQINGWSRQTIGKFGQINKALDLSLGKLLSEKPELIQDSELSEFKHHLERLHAASKYHLSEGEEKAIIQKDLNGIRLFSQLQSSWVSEKSFEVELEGETKTLTYNQLSALRMNPNRDIRRMATETVYKSYSDDKLLHSHALRSICADHLAMTKLRGHPSPMTQSLLDQDVDEEAINALLSTIENTSDKYREFLKIKSKIMGIENMEGHDVMAPPSDTPVWHFSWDEARKIVVDAFGSFDPEFGTVVENMFVNERIDSANRMGKTSGAFCARHGTAKSSFVFTSYNETMNDLYTLAHELGHAVQGHVTYHAQAPLNWSTSSCLAEMGSIFGELLLTDKILAMSESKEQKIEILTHVLSSYTYVVYYVGLRALFEQSLYAAIEEGKLIDAETASNLWNAAKKRIFADSVDWNDYMEFEWARIPHHFIPNYRFYNYSYSFAQMLVFALYEVYKEEGDAFKSRFRDLLSRGGTKSVRDNLLDFGFDINDPAFWELGAKQANRFLEELKALL